MPSPPVEALTRIVVRPIGAALPLGLFAFGIAVLLLSVYEARWIAVGNERYLAFIFFGIAAPLEAAAMVLCFLARDTLGGTTLGLFSGSWVFQGLFFLNGAPSLPNPVAAFLMAALALSLLVIGSVALTGKPFFGAVIYLAAVKLGLGAAHYFGAGDTVTSISAWIGLVISAASYYGAFALLVEDAKQKTVLPLFRRGTSRQAMEGSLSDQLQRIPREAGVRQQL